MLVKEYVPDLVIVTWGPFEIDGFATDSIIMIEYDEQAATKTVGSKGAVAVTKNSNRAGKATLRLQQGADMNKLLTKASAQFGPRQSRMQIYPLIVTDLINNTLVEAPDAWIQKTANFERAKEHKDREWVFDLAEIAIIET